MDHNFSALVDNYHGMVYGHAYRILGNREDAEEATQDVFMRIYRSIEKFRGESKITTWIYRITFNVCLNRLRRMQLQIVNIDDPIDDEGSTMEEFIADDSPGPEREFESKQLAGLVQSQLRMLPPNWAMALSLCYYESLSYDEIAEIMEIPKATVATYIFRGKNKLAEQLTTLMNNENLI